MCITRNRRKWLPLAIQCFQQQTYPNRELLILADGESVKDLVPDDERIRLIGLSGNPQIGAKRNMACAMANGELIAHWDDDDWSAPERLADQVKRLMGSGLAVTGYCAMRFTDGAKWWIYSGEEHWATGTSLVYRKDWWTSHPFQSLHVGEDNRFVGDAADAGQLVTSDAGELMWATIHPGNTSPRDCNGIRWKEL